jgi:hypothetical protein
MPNDRIFRYVRHPDVPTYQALGWHLVPALEGTPHGEWSQLMEYRGPDREHPMSPPNDQ